MISGRVEINQFFKIHSVLAAKFSGVHCKIIAQHKWKFEYFEIIEILLPINISTIWNYWCYGT